MQMVGAAMGAIIVGTLAATRLRVGDYCERVQDNGHCIGDAIRVTVGIRTRL